MPLSCPQCNQALPEVDELQYRFCPHCGAEIDTKPHALDDAFLTIPPDSPPPLEDAEPKDPDPAPERTTPINGQFDDQTIAPQPVTPEKRPQIRPPAEPPPPSLFRTLPSETDPPPPIPKKQHAESLPPEPPKKTATKNHQKVIIAVLIILALVIILLGGLFTF